MPHTQQQIQQFLQNADYRPQYKWGQNFLIDLNLMYCLLDAAGLQPHDTVLEVGTGTGSLTELIAERAGGTVTVEIDKQLAEIAAANLSNFQNISLIHTDILATKSTIDPVVLAAVDKACRHYDHPFKLVANLPYQIASPLMINLLMDANKPSGMYITIQAEVAKRMTALPGTRDYGLLTILMQATGHVKQIRKLPPQAFWPAPKVSSAMIAWTIDLEKLQHIKNLKMLRQVIDLLLGHRRKKIGTCLNAKAPNLDFNPLLGKLNIDPNHRGETLTPQQFVALANLLA